MRLGAWLAIALLGLAACGGGGGGVPSGPAFVQLTTFQAADVVVGQPIFVFNDPNQGSSAPSGQTLASPGMPSTGPFFLPDTDNNRVLGYHRVPFLNHIAANFVLGQPGLGFAFEGVGPTALRAPLCVRVHGNRLFVTDSGNHRVLIWDPMPQSNAAPAAVALGQQDLSSALVGTGPSSLWDPAGLCLAGSRLLVADRSNHRVLIWNSVPTVSGTPADIVLGQADLEQGEPNRGAAPGPGTLHDPFSVWSDGTRVVVADRGNHRVLIWRTFPQTHGQPADIVLGQPGFDEDTPRLGAQGLSSPSDVASNGTQLFVADAGNNRVLVWNAFPLAREALADAVLGQASFDIGAANDKNQDGRADLVANDCTLASVGGVLTVQIVDGQLFVGDTGNHRVLVFHGN